MIILAKTGHEIAIESVNNNYHEINETDHWHYNCIAVSL